MIGATRGRAALSAWCLLLVLVVAALPPRQGDAADIALGNIIPGGGIIHKSITSMREARFTNVVPQRTDFSCGAAAVATILKYAYDKEVDEAFVLRGMLKVADKELVMRKGFSLLDMKRYAEAIGMRAIGFKIAPEDLDQVKMPTIVLLDIKGYKHFVVFKKARGGKVYVGDPALGNKIYAVDAFVDAWNGIIFAIVGSAFDQDTVLLRPAEPLSVAKLSGERLRVIDAEVFSFGYSHADLFAFF